MNHFTLSQALDIAFSLPVMPTEYGPLEIYIYGAEPYDYAKDKNKEVAEMKILMSLNMVKIRISDEKNLIQVLRR